MTSSSAVTQLLRDWSGGDQAALEQLIPVVHAELHRLAHHYLRRERRGHTLQTSALVNEAFLHLVDQNATWQNRAHFFGIAAQLMRRILVEYARNKNRAKRGGGWQRVSLDDAARAAPSEDADLIALDDALSTLAAIDPQQSRIVELRYFGGLTIEEAAEVLGVSHSTVEREWSLARAWLRRELTK
ncbi:MAG TPA: sigma-70 family RNA polymerase sigma factor [Blastocatellia bacterium]|nr:sigma-70 family RNA polymerase sigma factor [Blastocatellia bacterium]